MRIGFIGLGTMGGAASLNLIKGGHELTVCDLDRNRGKAHLELGAHGRTHRPWPLRVPM